LFKSGIDGINYFKINDSPGIISSVGLPEAVRQHTDLEIAESDDAMKLATKIAGQMDDFAKSQTPIRLLYSNVTFEPAAQRLTNLDIGAGYIKQKSPVYTEQSNLPLSTPIPLKTRIKAEEIFQQMTKGGHLFDIRLVEPFPTNDVLANYTKRIMETTGIGMFTFTRDYVYCYSCKSISYGFHDKCPRCGYDGSKLVLYTKTFGKYKSSKAWNISEKEFALNNQRFTL
jgi:anaerobic ribonucleoside-triphosphate reductase